MKKYLSLLLCAVMILSLCACGTTQTAAPVKAAESETAEAESTAAVGTTLSAEDGEALLYALADKYDDNAIVLKADDMEIPWSVFYYFIQSNLSSFLYYGGLPTDYSTELNPGEPMDTTLVKSVEEYVRRLTAASEHSSLTKEQLDEDFDAYWNDLIEQFGDEETLNAQLDAAGYTKESLRFFDYSNAYVQDAFYGTYGEDFSQITDELVKSWVEENGYVRTKHILLLADKETLSEEECAAKKQQLEDVRTELLAIEDDAEREVYFDDQMSILSEDGGLASYPDGYTFTAGTMVAEFEDAAFALQNYEISDVVETSYGYHLLMGVPVEKDSIIEYDSSTYEPITVANSVANEDFTDKLTDWAEDVEITYSDEFEGFTVQSLFENYQQVLDAYYAEEEVAAAAEAEALTLPAGEDGMAEDGKLHVYPFGAFEDADTSDSSVIKAARYYESGHLILTVAGKTEVFVKVPQSVWKAFKASDMKGTYYNKYLKGNAAYAVEGVPAGKEVAIVVE